MGHMKKSGSVVVFSLMILSVIVVLTEQLFRSVYVSSSFIVAMIDRERAEMLALSGINLAIAQLLPDKKEKKGEKEATTEDQLPDENQQPSEAGKKPAKDDKTKRFLMRVLPHLNRWQTFNLQEKFDGIDAQIKICVSCEHGKINLNEVFDFEKQEFKKEYEGMLKGLTIKGKMAPGEIHNKLVEFLKGRRKKLYDISELYSISGFENIDIFYKPPKIAEKKGEKYSPNVDVTLQDIFTIWTSDHEMHPLLFSDSLCAMFSLRRPIANDATTMKDKFKQLIESYKDDWGNDWDGNWKSLQIIYDQKPKFIKDIQGIFSKQFGPRVYSVLSCGKVGQVEQKLLAIIKLVTEERDDSKKEEKSTVVAGSKNLDEKDRGSQDRFKIIRLYWL